LAAQISSATAHWKNVQDQAGKTVATAGEIAERMAAEAKAFSEFMLKSNDTEKAHLRLEVDKLHRGETESLQAIVRVFDHVFALYLAGVRSNQPNLRDQLAQFQNACREALRRLGLTPFEVPPDEPFDAKLHTLIDPEAKPPPGARVAQTLATGFTYQGQLLRPALVALQAEPAEPAPPEPTPNAS
jgi:molecular chaperone GrpE (heat shock protein)